MYREILVAIDFSEPSVEALHWAVRRFPDARFTLFHALERVRLPGYLKRELGGTLDPRQGRELDARSNLEHLAGELGLEPRVALRSGWPPREAEEAAEELGADLIVAGAHTRRMLPWDQPGATAARMVEEAERPVLVWRRAPRPAAEEDRTVMAALDLREGSGSVAATAARMASHFGARLVLVHVVPGTLQPYIRAVSTKGRTRDAMQQVERAARQEAMGQVPAELTEGLYVRAVVSRGRPVTQVLAVAESESADLLVMGQSHAARLARRTLLGSVTESVLHGANTAVLTVPTVP